MVYQVVVHLPANISAVGNKVQTWNFSTYGGQDRPLYRGKFMNKVPYKFTVAYFYQIL